MADKTSQNGMSAERLGAFSDGVIAIILTIMVLNLGPPHTRDPRELLNLWPQVTAYALSFILVATYWVNHHHLLYANRRVGWEILWANIHWLFWLSLFPFAAAYLSQTQGAPAAIVLYGCLGFLTSLAFAVLGTLLARRNRHVGVVRLVVGRRVVKVLLAAVSNIAAVASAREPKIALVLLAAPAVAYLVPERAVERMEVDGDRSA